MITRQMVDRVGVALSDVDEDLFTPQELLCPMDVAEWNEGSSPPSPTHYTRTRRCYRIAAAASRECRAKFAFRSRTEANELVAHKWMYDYVVSLRDMRRTDAHVILPIALQLVFVPASYEIEASQIQFVPAVQRRIALMSATWAVERSWYEWLTGRFSRPVVTPMSD